MIGFIETNNKAFRQFALKCKSRCKKTELQSGTFQEMCSGQFVQIQGALLAFISIQEKSMITQQAFDLVTHAFGEQLANVAELDRLIKSNYNSEVYTDQLITTYEFIDALNEELSLQSNGRIDRFEYVITYVVLLNQLKSYITESLHVSSPKMNQIIDMLADRCADAQIERMKVTQYEERVENEHWSHLSEYRNDLNELQKKLAPIVNLLKEFHYKSSDEGDDFTFEWLVKGSFPGFLFEFTLETICHLDGFNGHDDAKLLSYMYFGNIDTNFVIDVERGYKDLFSNTFDLESSVLRSMFKSIRRYDQFLDSRHASYKDGTLSIMMLQAVEQYCRSISSLLPDHREGVNRVLAYVRKWKNELKNGTTIPTSAQNITPKNQVQPTKKASAEDFNTIIQEFESLIGLSSIKNEIMKFTNLVRTYVLRRERGIPTPPLSLHMIFVGNPGTGKTTVARYIGRILKSLGLLAKGHLVETDRSGMVAGYVGQTALKVEQLFSEALGGVLFIDESYSLSRGGEQDFGREAIDTLIKRMEDHKNEVCVIVAGYTEEMTDFLQTNPGLQSRFNRHIAFADYTPSELVDIFQLQCEKYGYQMNEDAKEILLSIFHKMCTSRDKHFGNGRLARNLFEKVISNQSDRIVQVINPTNTELMTITDEDMQNTKVELISD